jgi:hypothetical protein
VGFYLLLDDLFKCWRTSKSIKHLEKISQVYGGKHLIFMNIPPIKEEGYYAYSLRAGGILHV